MIPTHWVLDFCCIALSVTPAIIALCVSFILGEVCNDALKEHFREYLVLRRQVWRAEHEAKIKLIKGLD